MVLKNALNKFEEIVLERNDDTLEEIYLELLKGFHNIQEQYENLHKEKQDLEEHNEELKQTLWDNQEYRKSIVAKVKAI